MPELEPQDGDRSVCTVCDGPIVFCVVRGGSGTKVWLHMADLTAFGRVKFHAGKPKEAVSV